MAQATTHPVSGARTRTGVGVAAVAWVVAATFYFYQYVVRSAPSVMMPQLSDAFGLSALGVASVVGLYYYGYAPFGLVAGVSIDRLGTRWLLPAASAVMCVGALLFATGSPEVAGAGRFLQGAGGTFAAVGALYIAANYFEPSKSGTLTGATQMFGMAGGSAGQFAVGPLIGAGVAWDAFWVGMAVVSLLLGVSLWFLLPKEEEKKTGRPDNWMKGTAAAFKVVFRNPQSILCGLIAGLLFIPTTIFDMVWGVRYLQEAHGLDYGSAVMRSATVPFGWIIGCPLLGLVSDRLGRRKPVIIGGACLLLACMAWILYGPAGVFPPYVLGLVTGVASGAAMLPYTVIKEANPPQLAGTATGVIHFLNFTFSALLGPAFAGILQRASGGATQLERVDFQTAFAPMLYGVAFAILLALLLKETGAAARTATHGATEEA